MACSEKRLHFQFFFHPIPCEGSSVWTFITLRLDDRGVLHKVRLINPRWMWEWCIRGNEHITPANELRVFYPSFQSQRANRKNTSRRRSSLSRKSPACFHPTKRKKNPVKTKVIIMKIITIGYSLVLPQDIFDKCLIFSGMCFRSAVPCSVLILQFPFVVFRVPSLLSRGW